MGTRNLTAVFYKGEYRVAQYGQFDGYPEGVGVSLLRFIKECDREQLKKNLLKCRFLDREERDKEFIEEYDRNTPAWSNEPDNRTPEQKRWFSMYINRSLADDVLVNIINSEDEEMLLDNSIDFANDSLFCEYAYVIDLDKSTFEVYEGFNKESHKGERFSSDSDVDGYKPVKLSKCFELDSLPEEDLFLSFFEQDEE